MTEHFNKLSEAEAERLSLLLEECGEVIHVIGKILRHGYESYHPLDENKTSNRKLLEKEIGDLGFAANLLVKNGDVSDASIDTAFLEKEKNVKQYLHHN